MVASRSSPIGTYAALAMLLVAFVAVAALLGPVATPQKSAPHWLPARPVSIPDDLVITAHAKKHLGEQLDAWKIYDLILEGRCTAAGKYCSPRGVTLYLCTDPVSGITGGLFVVGNAITSGYGSEYWGDLVRGDDAPFKPELCYVH